MREYFFWCGIVINGLMAIGLLIGLWFSLSAWIEGIKEDLKDARNRDGAEFEGTNPVANGTIRRDTEQP